MHPYSHTRKYFLYQPRKTSHSKRYVPTPKCNLSILNGFLGHAIPNVVDAKMTTLHSKILVSIISKVFNILFTLSIKNSLLKKSQNMQYINNKQFKIHWNKTTNRITLLLVKLRITV